MSLNFMNVGFAFAAKDKGLAKAQKAAREEFGLMRDSVLKLDSILKTNRMSTFIQSMSLGKLNRIGSTLTDLNANVGTLTTGFEEMAFHNTVAAKKTLTNLGSMTKQFGITAGSLSSLSIEINRPVDAINSTFESIARNVDKATLQTMGGLKEVVKIEDVTGMKSGELAETIKILQKRFGASADEAMGLVDASAAIGKMFGNTTGAAADFAAITATLNEEMSSLVSESPEKAKQMALGATAVSSAMLQMGIGQDKARESATALMVAQLSGKKAIEGMYAGLESDLAPLHTEMSIFFGSQEKAWAMLQEDPLQFQINIAKMGLAARKSGSTQEFAFSRMIKQMKEVNPQLANLGQSFDENMIKKMEEAHEIVKDPKKGPKGTLKQAVDAAFSANRTLADTMDLMKQQFIAKLRTASDANQKLVASSREAYAKMADTLTTLAKDDSSPMGAMVQKMIQMHQIGVKALLPEALRPMAEMFGTLVTESAPLLGALHSMGLSLGSLLNPFVLVTAAVAALGAGYAAFAMKERAEDLKPYSKELDSINSQMKGLNKTDAKYLELQKRKNVIQFKAKSKRSGTIGERYASQVEVFLDNATTKLASFTDKLPAVAESIGKAIEGMFSGTSGKGGKKSTGARILASLTKSLRNIGGSIARIAKPIMDLLTRAFTWVGKELSSYNWRGLFDKVFSGIKSFLDGKEGTAGGDIASSFGNMIGAALSAGWEIVKSIGSGLVSSWWDTFFGSWSDETVPIKKKLMDSLKGIGVALAGACLLVPGLGSTMLGGLGSTLVKVLGAGVKSAGGLLANSLTAAGYLISSSSSIVGKVLGGAGDVFVKAMELAGRGVTAAGESAISFSGLLGKAGGSVAMKLIGQAGLAAAVGTAAYGLTRLAMSTKVAGYSLDDLVQWEMGLASKVIKWWYDGLSGFFSSIWSWFKLNWPTWLPGGLSDKEKEDLKKEISENEKSKLRGDVSATAIGGLAKALEAVQSGKASEKQLNLIREQYKGIGSKDEFTSAVSTGTKMSQADIQSALESALMISPAGRAVVGSSSIPSISDTGDLAATSGLSNMGGAGSVVANMDTSSLVSAINRPAWVDEMLAALRDRGGAYRPVRTQGGTRAGKPPTAVLPPNKGVGNAAGSDMNGNLVYDTDFGWGTSGG